MGKRAIYRYIFNFESAVSYKGLNVAGCALDLLVRIFDQDGNEVLMDREPCEKAMDEIAQSFFVFVVPQTQAIAVVRDDDYPLRDVCVDGKKIVRAEAAVAGFHLRVVCSDNGLDTEDKRCSSVEDSVSEQEAYDVYDGNRDAILNVGVRAHYGSLALSGIEDVERFQYLATDADYPSAHLKLTRDGAKLITAG